MVTFGDSYADSTTSQTTWPYWLHQYIPTLTLKNYAVSGAGFNVDTRTFINQINNAQDISKNTQDISKNTQDISKNTQDWETIS